MLTVEEIMTQDVVTVRPETSVREAIQILLRESISGLPVTGAEGRLVGMITEFAMLAVAYDDRVQDHTVVEHMTAEVITAEPSDTVRRVADLCILNRVRRVPVLREGRIVGLVSRRDVLRALYESGAPACAI